MNNEKFALRQKTRRNYILRVALNGLSKLWKTKWPMCLIALAAMAVVSMILTAHTLHDWSVAFTAVLMFFVGVPVVAYAAGCVPGAWAIYEDMVRIGMVNAAGEAPVLLERWHKEGNLYAMRFRAKGFPLSVWEDMKEKIETAANITVVRFDEGNSKREVVMEYVSGNIVLPHLVRWNWEYLSQDDFKIALGESIMRPVYIDLAQNPHVLVGGTTASGKTKLLELIGTQVIEKCASFMIADYKGVDFGQFVGRARIARNNEEFLTVLEYLNEELARRKSAFVQHDCRNIAEYYSKNEKWMPRIVLMVDEASFVFDTTGVTDKTVKEHVSRILGALINLARVGRFAGIHIIVATQRPDTLSVPGALKANLDTRICARMPDVATSTVILDDGSATNLPSIKGRFILRDGSGTDTIFQAYLPDE